MDFTTALVILGAVKTVLDLGEKVYRFGTALLKKSKTVSVPKIQRYQYKKIGSWVPNFLVPSFQKKLTALVPNLRY